MKKLLMITNYFPYGNDTGEIYLRNEIFKLSENFDSIVIIACDACKEDKLFTENLPTNVTPIALAKKKKKSKISYLPKMFSTILGKKDKEVKEEWNNKKGFMKHAFLSYFIAKTKNRMSKISSLDIFNDYKSKDEIFIYSYRLFDLAYIGIKLKEKLKIENNCKQIKVFVRAHRYDLYEDRNKINYLPLREYLLDNSNRIYPCSKDGETYLKQRYPKYSNKIVCFYLGSKDCNYTLLPIQNKTLEIVSCSNVVPVKRVQMIGQVVRILSNQVKVHWTHIGGGVDFDTLKTECSDLIDKNIITLIGSLSHEKVLKYYQDHHFDLFMNLSLSEGLPQAIMEAISFGIPTLATDVGGTSEIVIENKSGYLVSAKETEENIAKKIVLYYNKSDEEIKKLRKSCRNFWEKNFNSEMNTNQFIKELEKL